MIIIIIIIIIICHSPRLVGPKAVGIIIRTTVSVFRSGKKQNNSSEYVSLSCECENGKSSLEYLSGSANYYHYHNAENYEDVILIKMMITIPVFIMIKGAVCETCYRMCRNSKGCQVSGHCSDPAWNKYKFQNCTTNTFDIWTKCFGIFNVRPKELQSIMT